MSKPNGFTLVELMVTLALVAILLTVAVPSFFTTIQNNRLTTQFNDFVTDLNLARSEAVKRGSRVTVCKKTADNSACTTAGNWNAGWLVFADPDDNGVFSGVDELIRVHEAFVNADTTLVGNAFVDDYISYGDAGFTQFANSNAFQAGTLVMCDSRGFEDYAKVLVINNTGRLTALDANDSNESDCNAS